MYIKTCLVSARNTTRSKMSNHVPVYQHSKDKAKS